MNQDLIDRVVVVARYIVDNGATVRSTAKEFSYSKSTVHKDVSERLYYIDQSLYKKVKKVWRIFPRHIR